jgi:hypothetical protein
MSDDQTMTEPGIEARVGARWWADKLRDDFALDNADPEEPEGGRALLDLARDTARTDLSAAKIDAFEAALAPRIQGLLEEGAGPYATAMVLSVDYGPSRMLTEALEQAGIRPSAASLPWKTCMWVQPGSVKVGDGYRAEPRELPLS